METKFLITTSETSRSRLTILGFIVATSVAVSFALPATAETEQTGLSVPEMGSAQDFAVLAYSGITNGGTTTVSGTGGTDIGSANTPTVTGIEGLSTTGTLYTALDDAVVTAKIDLESAYNEVRTMPVTHNGVMVLDNLILTPGVYNSGSSMGLAVNQLLTLDGGGDDNAIFIFQAGSTVITGSGSSIELINGAQAANVFWQVGSSATLGTSSLFVGTVLAHTSITAANGAIIHGQLLAMGAAVTLDANTIINNTAEVTQAPDPDGSVEGEDEENPGSDPDSGSDPDAGVDPGATPDPGTPGSDEVQDSVEADGSEEQAPSSAERLRPPTKTEAGGVIPETGTNDWFISLLVGLGVALSGLVALAKARRV